MDATMLIIILITLLVLIANVPIAFALSTAGFLILFFYDSSPLSFFIQTSFSSSSQFTLLAIPFFILAGDIMSSGGIAARLIDFIRSIIGSATGGLGVITILSSLIFAAISGSGA